MVASDDHNAESSVTTFGRVIWGGTRPRLDSFFSPPFDARSPDFLFFPLLLFLPDAPAPRASPPFGAFVYGLSGTGPGVDMNDAVSTESKRSAADGKDNFWAIPGGNGSGGTKIMMREIRVEPRDGERNATAESYGVRLCVCVCWKEDATELP